MNKPARITFLLLSAILLYINPVVAQNYFVVHTDGEILIEKTGESIKPGDKIPEGTFLVFGDKEAKAIVLTRKEGRLLLSPKSIASKNSKLREEIAKAVYPSRSYASRAVNMGGGSLQEVGVSNLSDYFGEGKFAIIGNELEVKLNSEVYPLDKEKVMVLYYQVSNDKKEANKEINTLPENKILLHKDSLYHDVEPALTKDNSIYYFNKATEEARKLAGFQPVFIDEAKLLKEVKMIYDFMSEKNMAKGEELYDEMMSFVVDLYGKVDPAFFDAWTAKHGINSKGK